MNSTEALVAAGLTQGEAKIYLALLEIGKSSAGQIVKKSGVSPSKIYDILERLMNKGIVGFVVGGNTRYYNAINPRQLRILLEESKEKYEKAIKSQEMGITQAIKQLKGLDRNMEEVSAEIMYGIKGIKNFFELLLSELKKGEEAMVLGYSLNAGILFDQYFVDFNKRFGKKGLKDRVIFEHDAWFRKTRESRSHAKYRYLPKNVNVPAFICIYKDVTGTIILTEKQKLCFIIRNKDVAASYKQYFELIWKQAKIAR